jgi:hypothetical protein
VGGFQSVCAVVYGPNLRPPGAIQVVPRAYREGADVETSVRSCAGTTGVHLALEVSVIRFSFVSVPVYAFPRFARQIRERVEVSVRVTLVCVVVVLMCVCVWW